MTEMVIVVGDKVWRLTPAEAEAVGRCLGGGAEGLLAPGAGSPLGYFGSPAGVRAARSGVDKLTGALSACARSGRRE